MDKGGHIYELTKEEQEALFKPKPETEREVELREDVARLDGYLKARAEADAPTRERPNADLTRRRIGG